MDQESHSLLGLSKLRSKWRQVCRFDSLNDAGNEPGSVRTARSRLQDDRGLGLSETLGRELRSLMECVAFAQNPVGRRRNIRRGAVETFRDVAQKLKIAVRCAPGALAANKLDAPILANFGTAADQEQTDLPSRFEMRPSTGLKIDAFDLDGSQDSCAVDLLPDTQLREFLRGTIPHRNGTIFEDHLICNAFGRFQHCG